MDADLHERRMQMLGDYAEMALALAQDLHRAALNAEAAEEKVRCAEAFHRLGRGLRQSLALHARLERDAGQAAREAPAPAPAEPVPDRIRRVRRKATLKAAVERLIWTEREALEDPPEALLSQLDRLLATEFQTEAFLDTDPDLQIARLCAMLRAPPDSPSRGNGPARETPGPMAEVRRETPRIAGHACPRDADLPGIPGEDPRSPPFHPSG